jgi:adenosine deaminase
MLSAELLARLPKAELHVHLDGSLRSTTLIDLARQAKRPLPTQDPGALARYMRADGVRDLEEYLTRFAITTAVLQTPEALERVALEMVEDAAADGIRYLEVRYCPQLSCEEGMTLAEVMAAIGRGLRQGHREHHLRTGFIACTLRHYDPETSLAIAAAALAGRPEGVVGFDIAGGEAGRPALPHRAAFDLALRGGLGITAHAGEAAGAASIAEALFDCHAHRIGHGTRLFEDAELLAYVRDHRIPIEINITSNVQTRVVATARQHPVRKYFDAGIAVTLSSDNWLMGGASLSQEYWLAHTALRFTRIEIESMILNGFRAAFLPLPERRRMVVEVEAELAELR